SPARPIVPYWLRLLLSARCSDYMAIVRSFPHRYCFPRLPSSRESSSSRRSFPPRRASRAPRPNCPRRRSVASVDSFAFDMTGRRVNRRRLMTMFAVSGVSLVVVASSGDVDARKSDEGKKKKGSKDKQKGSGSAQDVVKEAQKYKGAKYKMGGESPKGFDCSGF